MIIVIMMTLVVLAAVLAPVGLVSTWTDWAAVLTCWALVMLLLSRRERRRAEAQGRELNIAR
jgi:hypothetical protein